MSNRSQSLWQACQCEAGASNKCKMKPTYFRLACMWNMRFIVQSKWNCHAREIMHLERVEVHLNPLFILAHYPIDYLCFICLKCGNSIQCTLNTSKCFPIGASETLRRAFPFWSQATRIFWKSSDASQKARDARACVLYVHLEWIPALRVDDACRLGAVWMPSTCTQTHRSAPVFSRAACICSV